jgi:outer membrane lipoprotein SlyB
MKIRNLALALMLGTALTACQKSQDTSAQDAAAAAQAAQVTAAQQAAEAAQQAADTAKTEAAAAQKRAATAERRANEAQKSQAAAAAVCNDCGTVVAIQAVKQKGSGSGIGAVGGAAAGGVVGHQIGGGRGKDVATVLGALAGAYAGNEAEKTIRETTVYDVTVRMDQSGASRTITVKDASGLSVGSKVRVDGDSLALR